ncbi:hypothetical protein BC939DRAFT_450296 [Gamsiella multidivaricata]|uniref:uncharacterized protein n=1 Tax=Gamsiella multidivaricata TaxID=101098 RepID=UPI0022205BC1|nr:uncharacterized protein BC939DRAFT_450296 [Gamsiella multidivaricata]KAI7824418.1 hypothetical protein BC939DRAFT_450296 [Gamsiella multidivaricata]
MRSKLRSSTISSLSLLLPFLLLSLILFTTHASLLDQCAFSIAALFVDPHVNECIPIAPLAQLANGTDVTPKLVNDTSTTFCAMPFCSAPTVSLMENTMNQNCAETTDDIDSNHWFYGFASLYVPFKQGMCQRVQTPPTNGTFCVTLLTESLNAYVAKHPNKKGWDILANSTEMQQYVDGIPTSMLCTACNKAMINPLMNFVEVRQLALDPVVVSWASSLGNGIQERCGEDFLSHMPPLAQQSLTPNDAYALRSSSSWRRSSLPAVWIAVLYLSTVIP